MPTRPPLPIFENRDDARRYLSALWAVVTGAVLMIGGVALSLVVSGALPVLMAAAGICTVLGGQALYLNLNARVWTRHYPKDPWDWRSARGFYEGSFTDTVARARAMAREK